MILHHYEPSPFSAKIRLMLDYCQIPWESLLSPAVPPRPNLDPLAGGYRKIPVAQIGADIFCDSRIISAEIAELAGKPALSPDNATGTQAELIRYAETNAFLAAFGSSTFMQTLSRLVSNFGVMGAFRFLKDRAGFSKDSDLSIPPQKEAVQIYAAYLQRLEGLLSETVYLAGDEPGAVDFAAWLPLFGPVVVGRAPLLADKPKVAAWCEKLWSFNLDTRREIKQEDAFKAAMAEPRPLPESLPGTPLGRQVEVGPADYAKDKVTGELVAQTETRIIVARNTVEFGRLHVHFPVQHFELELI